MRKYGFLWVILGCCVLTPCRSQSFVTSKDKDFEWRAMGRVLLDGGVFFSDSTDLGNAVTISDLRLGFAVRFLQNWSGRMELGYAASKVSIKDVFIEYTRGGVHSVKVGHYFEPFAIDIRIGTTDYRMLTMSATDKAFGDRRKLGASYIYDNHRVTASVGVFSDGDVDNVKSLNEGYSLTGKFVGRPVYDDEKLVHLGVSARFSEHDKEENRMVTYVAGAPTELLTKENNQFIKAEVSDMINQWRFSTDIIMYYKRWYLQSEFILAHVNRFGVPNYTGQGGYGQLGFLLLGNKQYRYNQGQGWVTNPDGGNMELLFRYNMTSLNDSKAGVFGGREQDVTVGVNYFFNKYIAARLNYTRVMVGDHAPGGKEDFDLVQARVQFSF